VTLGAGDLLDSYRIVAPLKTGGMARLYLARREGAAGFAKPVAIKVIHPHLASEKDFVDRFITEARLSASIVDPHVVHVEGLGEAHGTLYIAMEYVHGLSLAEIDRELTYANRRLSTAASAYIASRVAMGLHAAHETVDARGTPLGIIHRDVSPQNVIVAFSGHVKVIDFGIAKASVVRTVTGDSSLYGKLAYMAPEHARGEEIDRRADIFALGIVLWEMLTRKRLFAADNDIALLNLIATKTIESPRVHVPEIPEALEAVVMKALARDRDRRWSTAGEFARAIADAVPEIRSMEPGDLGALLRAIAPAQLTKKNALLAKVVGADPSAPEPVTAGHDPEMTTRVRLRPDEALAQLTLPVPFGGEEDTKRDAPPSFDHDTERNAATSAGTDPAEASRTPASRTRSRRWLVFALGALLPAVAYGVWAAASDRAAEEPAPEIASRSATTPDASERSSEDEGPAAAMSAEAPSSAPPSSPEPATSVATTEEPTTKAPAPVRKETRPTTRPKRSSRDRVVPQNESTTSANRPEHCRVIDGVELCR